MTTQKIRKGPTESATKFDIGTIKKSSDGNTWIIIQSKNGVKRWKKNRNKK